MNRYATFAALFVATLAFAGCSNSDQPAAGDRGPSQQVTATDASGGQCDAYIAAVKNVCLDSMTRDLDMSCNNELIALGVVQDQAAGNLFDVGSDEANAKVVDSVCSRYLGSLQKKRAEKDASMTPEGSAGPMCTTLAESFDATCLTKLGQEPLSDECKNTARMMAVMGSVDAEEGCGTVAKLMSPDQS